MLVSLEANTDLTRLYGFKKEGAMPVYSCPVIVYIVNAVPYMKKKPRASLEHSFCLRLFPLAPPLDHLCPAVLIEN